MDLPWIAVRIGRSAACEIRLDDPEIPGEACRLQRRGRSWRIIPLGTRGAVFLEGTPVAEACPLPFDLPFRVGSTCFTLRRNRSVEPDWGMYHAPSPMTATAPEVPPPAPEPTPPSPSSFVTHAYAPAQAHAAPKDAGEPRPSPAQSPSPSSAPAPSANPWEARWKAAGARLLAASDRDRLRPQPHAAAGPRPVPPAGERPRPPAAPPIPASRPAEAPARADLRAGFAASFPASPSTRGYPEAPRVAHRAERAERPAQPARSSTPPAPPASPPRAENPSQQPQPQPQAELDLAPPIPAAAEPVSEPPTPEPAAVVPESTAPLVAAEFDEEPAAAVPEPTAPLVVAEFDEVADAIAAFASETVASPAETSASDLSPAVSATPVADAPTASVVEAPVEEEVAVVVAASIESPVAEEVAVVVEAPIESPAEEIASPIEEEPVVVVEAQAPLEQEIASPVEEEAAVVVEATIESPIEAIADVVEAPAPVVVEAPVEEEIASPVEEEAAVVVEVPVAAEVPTPPAEAVAVPVQSPDPWAPIWIMGQAAEFTTATSWPEIGGGTFGQAALDPLMISPAIEPAPRQDAPAQVRSATLLDAARPVRDDRLRDAPRPAPFDREPERPAAAAVADSPTTERARQPRPEPKPEREPEPEFHLPSAKDIMAAAPRRAAASAAAAARSNGPAVRLARPPQREHIAPTIPLEPAAWSLPAWLAGPPLAALALTIGVPGAWLASWWAGDSNNASVIGQRLLAAKAGPVKERPLPETITPPVAAWWRTTPLHLAEWGIYRSRATATAEEREEADELLEKAVQLAPLHPLARLAQAEARPGAAPGGPAPAMARNLGLSRDPASLSWSARSLRRAGKNAAAARLYRRAFLLAESQGAANLPRPTFNATPGVLRYELPGEAAAAAIVRELLADAEWPCREWIESLPPDGVAALAAARLLREQDRPEARDVLERILSPRRDDAAPGKPTGPDQAEAVAEAGAGRDRDSTGGEGDGGDGAEAQVPAAIRLAVAAEAHGLLDRWGDAEAAYRRAIDLEEDVTTRRAWWFNLATLASRGSDETQRKAALEAAIEVSSADEIGRRAVEMQRATELSVRPRIGSARAN